MKHGYKPYYTDHHTVKGAPTRYPAPRVTCESSFARSSDIGSLPIFTSYSVRQSSLQSNDPKEFGATSGIEESDRPPVSGKAKGDTVRITKSSDVASAAILFAMNVVNL